MEFRIVDLVRADHRFTHVTSRTARYHAGRVTSKRRVYLNGEVHHPGQGRQTIYSDRQIIKPHQPSSQTKPPPFNPANSMPSPSIQAPPTTFTSVQGPSTTFTSLKSPSRTSHRPNTPSPSAPPPHTTRSDSCPGHPHPDTPRTSSRR